MSFDIVVNDHEVKITPQKVGAMARIVGECEGRTFFCAIANRNTILFRKAAGLGVMEWNEDLETIQAIHNEYVRVRDGENN